MEKEELYEILDRVVTREKVLIGGDFNCYFGKEACGSGEIHGGHVVGQWNDECVCVCVCVCV